MDRYTIALLKVLNLFNIHFKMHILQPKHIKLKQEEVDKLLIDLNISTGQLPKIKITDTALPEGCNMGDIFKIERKVDGKTTFYYRVVAV